MPSPARVPAATPEAIIFDIGRVIVRVNPERAFRPAISTLEGFDHPQKPSPEEMWTAIQADPRWCDWQEGRMTPHEWYEHMGRRFGLAVGFEEFCAEWNAALDPQPILPDSLFSQLAKRCRLGLLSNTDPIHAAHLERHFSFVRHFPVRIYSNEVGTSKPSPAIYHAALAALGVAPAEALYIDDIGEYAETARQLGLDAIRFESPEQLAGELAQRGLFP